LATTAPAVKLRFDASGRGASHGQTVMYPPADGVTAVTFRATAATPDGMTATVPSGVVTLSPTTCSSMR
jgi:hypothetical protein